MQQDESAGIDAPDPEDPGTVTVLIADDQAIIRRGLRDFLGESPDIEVVAEASTGYEAVSLAHAWRPDVILMDLRMPKGNGLEATRQILAESDRSKILILTTFERDEYLFVAMDLGASGFANKDLDLDDLSEAIRTVARGGCWLKPRLAARLAAEFANRKPVPVPTAGAAPELLTVRERQVAALISDGLSNQQIARRLHLEVTTVKAHIGSIFNRLDMNNRVQIAIWAHDRQLVFSAEDE
ncbi:response regulator [Propionibacterium acidifaciens]|uniref:Response regulator receiver domain protein n=1 Tax=Propionibacterium acidifaciens F0233 TaxID=553198 RepID=U2QYV9_9ACTN|nr:response regulator transcription factor [Propionibacterium acidifaciens]AYW77727.1 DNA-binding response regulator [Propionibacterium acidifaciens]ERK61379.1 response regulator receiver domain protein [Propionibacterium acidifaciens F0233]